jgi:hypothetical protein
MSETKPIIDAWEPVYWRHQNGVIKDFWGVFHADDCAPEPIAVFSSEQDAQDWLTLMRAHPDENRRLLGGDFAVSLLRSKDVPCTDEDALYVWNSHDPAPEDGP